jgi:hypothetical protein
VSPEVKTHLKKISKVVLICAVVVLAASIGAVYAVYAENQDEETSIDDEGRGFFAMKGWGMPFRGVMGALTEEQRNELAAEIQDLVLSKFEEWGIELPEPMLSDEQRSELLAGIEQLREDGATREEIREYIAEKLEEWGVEPPELPDDYGRCKRRGHFMNRPPNGVWKRRFNDDTG